MSPPYPWNAAQISRTGISKGVAGPRVASLSLSAAATAPQAAPQGAGIVRAGVGFSRRPFCNYQFGLVCIWGSGTSLYFCLGAFSLFKHCSLTEHRAHPRWDFTAQYSQIPVQGAAAIVGGTLAKSTNEHMSIRHMSQSLPLTETHQLGQPNNFRSGLATGMFPSLNPIVSRPECFDKGELESFFRLVIGAALTPLLPLGG